MNTESLYFFNTNGCYGFSSYADTGFKSVKDVLEHMDRLGVSRSLVWYVPARDYDPFWGNERMLSDINEATDAGKRLVPAFAVSPVMLYGETALSELTAVIKKQGVRALRLFLTASGCRRFNLIQYEPLIEKLRDIKPVLLLNAREEYDTSEVLTFTEHFPEIPVIFTNVIWQDIVKVFDLMGRRRNIYLETSWLHTEGTIETAVSRFGADRVIFGMGPKSHNAASISALLHAGINDEERAMLAHGNLERLLGLVVAEDSASNCEKSRNIGKSGNNGNSTIVAAEACRYKQQSIEYRLRSFAKSGVDVIDAHGHLGTTGAYVMDKVRPEEQIRLLLGNMNKLGIREMIISGFQALFAEPVEGNIELERLLSPYKGRFKGYLAFNPFNGEELESRFDSFFEGDFFIGFKVLCDYYHVPVTDKRFEPVWEYAGRHRLPVLLHTWGGNYNSPAMLKDIVSKYSGASFILGHSGGNNEGRREAEVLAQENDNVYLEWCGSFCSDVLWEETIKKLGSERIVFGTDAILHSQTWELGRLLSLDVEDEALVPILGRNMREIMARRR